MTPSLYKSGRKLHKTDDSEIALAVSFSLPTKVFNSAYLFNGNSELMRKFRTRIRKRVIKMSMNIISIGHY